MALIYPRLAYRRRLPVPWPEVEPEMPEGEIPPLVPMPSISPLEWLGENRPLSPPLDTGVGELPPFTSPPPLYPYESGLEPPTIRPTEEPFEPGGAPPWLRDQPLNKLMRYLALRGLPEEVLKRVAPEDEPDITRERLESAQRAMNPNDPLAVLGGLAPIGGPVLALGTKVGGPALRAAQTVGEIGLEVMGQPVRRLGTQIAKEVVPTARRLLAEEAGGGKVPGEEPLGALPTKDEFLAAKTAEVQAKTPKGKPPNYTFSKWNDEYEALQARAAREADLPVQAGIARGPATLPGVEPPIEAVGTRLPNGGIVGAKLPPPTATIPTPGRPSQPRQIREFWARPLENAEMIAGAFKDNFWRQAAQRTGLRQFTSLIDPAALVSGTANDPLSITQRSLLLRNRVLDVGDSAVNGGMAWLRERTNPFTIVEARISSLLGKPAWGDVFDSPTRHKLSQEQKDYIQLFQDMIDDGVALLKENGIDVREIGFPADRHYIPRLVEAIRGLENEKAGRVGGRIGAKAGFQKTRFYEWMEEGIANGVLYSSDPQTVMEHYIQSVYRLVADKRLADELKPLGQTILERVELKAPGLIAAREISKKEFTRARELLSGVMRAYRGERLPPGLIKGISMSFPNEAAALRNAGPENPALQGIEATARQLMDTHRTKWKDLSIRMGRMKDAVQPGFDEGWIPQPFAQGRIFPKEVAETVNKAVGDQGNAWLRALQNPNALSRTMGTVFDFGSPFTLGLGVLGENPGAWARATLKHYQAWKDPALRQRFMVDNAEYIKEMAQIDVVVGSSEFFAGVGPAKGLAKLLPEEQRQVVTWLGKQTYGRFQESFGTFLDYSAVEVYKALRDRAMREGSDSLFALGDYINHIRGTMGRRTLGIGVTQEQIESNFMMFARNYTRAGMALMADVGTLPPYLKGNALRANLSAIIGSATVFFLAGAAAMNALGLMKPEEVAERLMPIKNGRFNAKFLTLPIGTDNVGMGGFGYAMLRLLAGTADKAINEPGDLLKLDAQDNPIMGFFRSRLIGGAPMAGLAIELTTGRNYFGQKLEPPMDYAKAVGKRFLPFWAEAYVLEEPPASLPSLPFAVGGQRVFSESYGARAAKLEEQLAAERDWTLPLNRDQRRQLAEANPELASLKEQADIQGEKYTKDEIQQQTANYFGSVDQGKELREKDLEAPYRGYLNGTLSGKDLLELRSEASTRMSGVIDNARTQNPLALVDRAQREAYYQANRIEIKEGNPDDIAAEGYYAIRVPSSEEGKDWDAFYEAREDYLKQFTPEVQEYILKVYPNKRFTQEWMNKLESQIQKDLESLKPYWEVPRELDKASTDFQRIGEKAQRLEAQYGGEWKDYLTETEKLLYKAREKSIELNRLILRNKSSLVDQALIKWRGVGEAKPVPTPTPTPQPNIPLPPTKRGQAPSEDFLRDIFVVQAITEWKLPGRPYYNQLTSGQRAVISERYEQANNIVKRKLGMSLTQVVDIMLTKGSNPKTLFDLLETEMGAFPKAPLEQPPPVLLPAYR